MQTHHSWLPPANAGRRQAPVLLSASNADSVWETTIGDCWSLFEDLEPILGAVGVHLEGSWALFWRFWGLWGWRGLL